MLQSLDTLGAGFQLASHDLDIRGAGNLLGEEQSGHIKEVGFELYQQMLEEAVASLKAGITEPVADRWSPQITIGTPVLIPEEYVADLPVRLGALPPARRARGRARDRRLRRRAGRPLRPAAGGGRAPARRSSRSRRCAAAPMSRRSTPGRRARCCRSATTPSPIRKGWSPIIREQGRGARVRPDMKVVFFDDWEEPEERLKGTTAILRSLVGHRRAGQGGVTGFCPDAQQTPPIPAQAGIESLLAAASPLQQSTGFPLPRETERVRWG